MKKNIITLILAALILSASALCSCNSTDTTTDLSVEDTSDTSVTVLSVEDTSDTSVTVPQEEEINFNLFPAVEATSSNIGKYRAEVTARLSSDDSFIRDYEWEVIEKYLPDSGMGKETLEPSSKFFTSYNHLFDSLSRYYYPVVFRNGEKSKSLIMWYTTESGDILFEDLNLDLYGGNFCGFAHHDSPEGEQTLESVTNYSTTYNQETGKVSKWKFGQIVETCSVPEGSIYCGISFFEGIIFRNETDVFALQGEECVVIAHNVKYVIDADYYYGSDPWCQPLFLMEDGSIKCYIGYEGNQEVPDDPSHLVDLMYEGSYDK